MKRRRSKEANTKIRPSAVYVLRLRLRGMHFQILLKQITHPPGI